MHWGEGRETFSPLQGWHTHSHERFRVSCSHELREERGTPCKYGENMQTRALLSCARSHSAASVRHTKFNSAALHDIIRVAWAWGWRLFTIESWKSRRLFLGFTFSLWLYSVAVRCWFMVCNSVILGCKEWRITSLSSSGSHWCL